MSYCDFCDTQVPAGQGGIANAALFPGYPAGRRKQSLGCISCLRERGADDGQLAVARKAAEIWWDRHKRGEDVYVTPQML